MTNSLWLEYGPRADDAQWCAVCKLNIVYTKAVYGVSFWGVHRFGSITYCDDCVDEDQLESDVENYVSQIMNDWGTG
nr:hypothetical protein [Rhodococcus sp. (in: high G+C Gram-positive bacteria)]